MTPGGYAAGKTPCDGINNEGRELVPFRMESTVASSLLQVRKGQQADGQFPKNNHIVENGSKHRESTAAFCANTLLAWWSVSSRLSSFPNFEEYMTRRSSYTNNTPYL